MSQQQFICTCIWKAADVHMTTLWGEEEMWIKSVSVSLVLFITLLWLITELYWNVTQFIILCFEVMS